MKVYLHPQPRCLALIQNNFALVFRTASTNKCIVEFTNLNKFDISSFRLLSTRECHGFLGLISLAGDIFLCVITSMYPAASPRPGETVNRIINVEFFCLTKSDWDYVQIDNNGTVLSVPNYSLSTDVFASNASGSTNPNNSYNNNSSNAGIYDKPSGSRDLTELSNSEGTPFSPGEVIDHPCLQIRKLLGDGSFYYSGDFDLTSSIQTRSNDTLDSSLNIGDIDEKFMWNAHLMSELLDFRKHLRPEEREDLDSCKILITVIRGYAYTINTRVSNKPARLTIISKQSSMRAGTRFNARGIDDEGHVANFVATETILTTQSFVYAYTQVRGSVPLFWEQDVNILSTKLNISRSLEASQPAFERHFESLLNKYGVVHIVNLLSKTKPGERELSEAYQKHVALANKKFKYQIHITNFDFHDVVAKGGGYAAASNIIVDLKDYIFDFGFYLYNSEKQSIQLEQTGIFRTNCLDCLDRTNLIQQLICRYTLELFCREKNMTDVSDLFSKHSIIWADNGDQLSRIYAGTGALKSSFTRSGKMNIAGALADATKSVSRMYINNFVDKSRQNNIDMLLGRLHGQERVILHDPINDYVTTELYKRRKNFSRQQQISIFVGSFNLNGTTDEASLEDWLFPDKDKMEPPDLIVVGFQEIVQLTAQQIINADPVKREFWEKRVIDCINKHDDYVLLRAGQLVGTALLMLVKSSQVKYVHNIEGAMKKTGLGGMAGNKGGVAFSIAYADTRLCFLTAHLAAGYNNIEERRHDFKTILTGIRFSRGRPISDHDGIIWFGDFNYRIGDFTNEEVRAKIAKGQFDDLYEHDQLNNAMLAGDAFPYFKEGKINFPPSYKFDNDTDNYDTSDKQRIPAWTDRILYRGKALQEVEYGSCRTIRFSDHRPIYARFTAEITITDENVKNKLAQGLYEKRRNEIGETNDLVSLRELNEITLTHGLPPPSSDRHKWWIDGGQQAKVILPGAVGKINPVINPALPLDPFKTKPDEPLFVEKPPLPPRPAGAKVNNPNPTSLLDDIDDNKPTKFSVSPSYTMSSISSLPTTSSLHAHPPPLPPRSKSNLSLVQSSHSIMNDKILSPIISFTSVDSSSTSTTNNSHSGPKKPVKPVSLRSSSIASHRSTDSESEYHNAKSDLELSSINSRASSTHSRLGNANSSSIERFVSNSTSGDSINKKVASLQIASHSKNTKGLSSHPPNLPPRKLDSQKDLLDKTKLDGNEEDTKNAKKSKSLDSWKPLVPDKST